MSIATNVLCQTLALLLYFFVQLIILQISDYCVRDAMKSSLIIKQHVEPKQVIIVQGTRD